MAVLHRATLEPGKAELVSAWLDTRPWAADGPTTLLGAYRYDDPEGAVGVEAFLVRRGEQLLHVPLTYRDAPLAGAEDALVGRTRHSVLGERWVHAAAADPVALGCFERALRGEHEQAPIEVWDGDVLVERREPTVRLRLEPADRGVGAGVDGGAGRGLQLVDVLDPAAPAAPGARLLARLDDDRLADHGLEAVVAVLR